MKAADIIRQVFQERGINSGEKNIDLVPLNDLNVHKKEVWSLSITTSPEDYFAEMDKKYKNKTAYYRKFALANLEEGLRLCRELSEDFGTQPCEMSSKQLLNADKTLYLVIHIHPEFSFTPKINKPLAATQEMVMNFM